MTDLKVSILYFSATGNCQRLASQISLRFKNSTLISMTNRSISLGEYDILFVIAPVYSQLCPAPIRKLLKKLGNLRTVVPCVCYGGISAGKALRQLSNTLKKSGASILAAAEFPCSHFYLKVADKFDNDFAIEALCQTAVNRLNNRQNIELIPVQHFNYLSYIAPALRARLGTKLVYINKKACLDCRQCGQNCVFNRKCVRCGFCVIHCKKHNKKLIVRPIMQWYLKKYFNPKSCAKIY